jgi:hypothetical protein
MSAGPPATERSALRKARAYIAGLGAAGALIGAAAIAFLTLGALVAFDGDQGDRADSEQDTVFTGAGGTVTALAPPSGGAGGAGGGGAGPGGGGSDGGGSDGGGGPGSGQGEPGVEGGGPAGGGPPPGSPPAPAPTPAGGALPAPPPASGTGPVGGLVDAVDGAAGGLGLDPGLGDATDPITSPVDETLQDTLPGMP